MMLSRVRRRGLALLLLALVGLPVTLHGALPAALDGAPLPSLAPMLERVTPAVVNIATRGKVIMRENPLARDPFFQFFFGSPRGPRERATQSLGSGVIVDAERGFVVTNHHVLENAQEIRVTLRDGREFDAEMVGADPDTDIALIRIAPDRLTALPLADSDELRVGDFVVAIGNPFGLGQTVTSGIVSALGRSGLGIEGYEDFIQTDASINVGNSGGALVNLRGELVGINTAIIGPSGGSVGIGFAIPINMAQRITSQLVDYGEVRRGLLGVATQDLTPALAEAFELPVRWGAVVVEVLQDSPADRAGLRASDVITSINGRRIEDSADVANSIGQLRTGETVEIEVLRDGRALRVSAALVDRPQAEIEAAALHRRLNGASLGEIPESSPLHGRIAGVLVSDVERGSPAWQVGLRPGDIITAVNRQPVQSLATFREALRGVGSLLMLNVVRGNASLFMLVQ
jgi:serine protease Do/serine protease DegQ